MNQRIQQFLAAENISQSQFADTIDVARATVSHIIAGRNKPGFDFIESVSRHYPSLSIEWLITGKGKMYKTQNYRPGLEEGSLFDDEQQINSSTELLKSPDNEMPAYVKDAAEAYNGQTRSDEALSSELAAADNAIKRNAERKRATQQPQQIQPAYSQQTNNRQQQSNRQTQSQQAPSIAISMNSKRRINKIIVFYDDNTFQELS